MKLTYINVIVIFNVTTRNFIMIIIKFEICGRQLIILVKLFTFYIMRYEITM